METDTAIIVGVMSGFMVPLLFILRGIRHDVSAHWDRLIEHEKDIAILMERTYGR